MKKQLVVFKCLLFMCMTSAFGQLLIKNTQQLNDLKEVPLEKMYVHHGSSLLFPGEYLVYSAYCINAYSYNLSDMSKIAYVELVSETGDLVFSHKVRLDKGRAQGDFFVPVDLPSGNYKLLGYTQWMKNGGLEQFFQDDIVVVNPYQGNQKRLTLDNGEMEVMMTPSSEQANSIAAGSDIIQLLTDTKKYGKRSKVSLSPKNYKGPLGFGNYSILVRKKSDIPRPENVSAYSFSQKTNTIDKFIPKTVNDSVYLPEQTGELFWGNVSDSGGSPALDKTVVISIPGEDFQLKYAKTDENGNFYTYLNKEYDAAQAIVQVINEDGNAFDIRIKEQSPLDYNGLKFKEFSISPEMERAIVQRSIDNQIENAFIAFTPDTVLSVKDTDPFIGGNPEIYNLDDYTRFNTLEETLVEVVDNVWVRKVDGKATFWVREYVEPTKDDQFINLPPLVLVDGVFIPDHGTIFDFNAFTIKSIKTVRDQFTLGGKEYLGMVVIETIDGNYSELWQENTSGIKKELFKPLTKKNYFNQSYAEGIEKERIPDFRKQLFWLPDLTIDAIDKNLEFYTSDVPGEYEIVLEGFTTYGKPISIRETITVE